MELYKSLRPILFRLDAERAHYAAKSILQGAQSIPSSERILRRHYGCRDESLQIDLWDKTFPNPVGLAAGFDKNAEVVHAIPAIGFGFLEVGTVTPRPQSGNPRPRLFRLPEDNALINRMGFNGHGSAQVRDRLAETDSPTVPLGINVGKMNDADEDEAVQDYRTVFERLYPFGDYFVVNISCPNTPEAYDEESPEHLSQLLTTLTSANSDEKPLLVKIGPDATEKAIIDVVEVVSSFPVDGFVATNTTTTREGVHSPYRTETGGLSGEPLEPISTDFIRTLYKHTELPIIGVGGVRDAGSAYRKIRAGASLVQLYTGLIYEGPSIARNINEGLIDRLERDSFDHISEAVGADVVE